MQPGADQIKILDDPIGLIRRRPEMFLQGLTSATGPWLVGALMTELAVLRALPASVDLVNGCWIVSSAEDWLVDSKPEFVIFRRLVAFPALGVNSFRHEVLLTAFAKSVAVRDPEQATWISGDPEALPDRGRLEVDSLRSVLFRMNSTSIASTND